MNEKPEWKGKFCPLLMIATISEEGLPLRKCLGDSCALFVRLWKPKVVKAGEETFAGPDVYQVYEGCGLIQQVPWAQQEYKKEKTEPAR